MSKRFIPALIVLLIAVTTIVPEPVNPDVSKPSGYIIYYGNEPRKYTESIEVGNVSSYELNLPPGTYYMALAAKTSTGFVGPLTKEINVTVTSGTPQPTFEDDFSTDTGMWTYVGDAYRDPINEYVVLTENKYNQVGVIWFNQAITTPFTVEFKYKAGGGTGTDGNGADGIVFMFYKKKDYTPGNGGRIGFIDNRDNPVPGYGIEFDNWYNQDPGYDDPSSNHIALIKDHVNNHLIYVNDIRTEDNRWHKVKVTVSTDIIEVEVDNGTVFTWEGTINRTYDGLGFSAATGGGGNNWHIIDDVKIKSIPQEINQPPVASFTFSPASPTVGEVITFDASTSYDPDGTIASHEWDFGDGNTASGITVQHTYSQPGTYTVTLTVTDNDGLQASISKQITVSAGESVPDDVDDTLERLVNKYKPSFDWRTDTPARQDVLQAVITAVV